MTRYVWVVMLVAALIRVSVSPAAAQSERPPTIFQFYGDIAQTTLAELEAGETTLTLHWHVAHVDQSHQLMLYGYQGYGWVPLHDAANPLPFVGDLAVPLAHPQNFTAPTFKLVLLGMRGGTLDERTLVIPYDQAALDGQTPVIETFSTPQQTLDAAQLASQGAQVPVAWQVAHRLPLSNLVFEQVLGDDQAQNIELARALLWVPSSGEGMVAPVQPPNGSVIRLRLRVLDVITAHVYDEKFITISVTGTALPPEVETALPQPTPSRQEVGRLTVSADCLTMASEATQRGWFDGDGIWSPDQRTIAYATNALGDARLVLSSADGSGQVQVEAPDKALPLGLFPAWSPDSERIAFASSALSPPGGGEIYVVQRDGTDLRRIASYVGYHADLAWSEDGTRVYFTSGEASGTGAGMLVGEYSVYAVTADGFGTPEPVSAGCAVR